MHGAVATVRYWGPILVGFLCLAASMFVAGVWIWLLVMASFAFMVDGATAMWARSGSAGRLTDYRQ